MPTAGWHTIDEDAHVLWREYEFASNAFATTLVFQGADGLVAVSPGPGVSAAEFDALAKHGEVRALIANNAHHTLGQAEWRARFPQAIGYAPADALPRLTKKFPGVAYRPLAELAMPANVQCVELPGCKNGAAFLSIHTKSGAAWFTGDLLTNITRMPGPPVRWLFTGTGSAPGYRLFKPGVWAFVRDRKALRTDMLRRLASDPPWVVVPAHGEPVAGPDLVALTRRQLERL